MIVGIAGDLHLPFGHPMYRRFCLDTFRKWKVDRVIFAGDIVDLHALSFWDHDPNGLSAADESKLAKQEVAKWTKSFPSASVCIGNHDERHYRIARKAGLPDNYLRSYAEVWKTPAWKWDFGFSIDGVNYEHGTGASGKNGALNLAIQRRRSSVIGHIHSWAGVQMHANKDNAIFGLNVGCGIDCRAYAFAYGRVFPVRPILGCGIVIDGAVPFFIPMAMGRGEKYNRRQAGKQPTPSKYIRQKRIKED